MDYVITLRVNIYAAIFGRYGLLVILHSGDMLTSWKMMVYKATETRWDAYALFRNIYYYDVIR